MDTARRIVCILMGIVLAITISVITMIKGWGVQPKSWFYIIVFHFVGLIIAHILIEIGKRDE